MNILITGANGIIGINLLKKIQSLNSYKLYTLSRQKTSILPDVKNIQADLTKIESLKTIPLNIDVIIHLAGMTHTNNKKLYYKINTEGTKNLLTIADKNKIKHFIFISTRSASWDGGDYAVSKLLAEQEVQKYKYNWTIFRLAEVYGAGEKEAIAKLIKIIKNNFFIPIIGKGNYFLNPVLIDDVVDVISKSLLSDISFKKIYTIAGPNEISYKTLIEIILKNLDSKKIKIHIPLFLIKIIAKFCALLHLNIIVQDQIPRLLCYKSNDISQAKKDFNFSPIDFKDGFKKLKTKHKHHHLYYPKNNLN